MTNFGDELVRVEMEKRRFAVLAILEDVVPDHALDRAIIMLGVRAKGLPCTIEQVKEDVDWLKQRSFVKVDTIANLTIVSMTPTGREVAQGHRVVEGLFRFGADL